MHNTSFSILKLIHFNQTSDWNIKQIISSVSLESDYNTEKIGNCITRIKNEVKVQDDILYNRLTIRTKGGGVSVRDSLFGKDIKTKNQYRVSTGLLAVSKIDARNGAFGLVPIDANDAIITGNFWAYEINENKVIPQYLVLLLSSYKFIQAWLECSNGSGNRLYLQEEKFLNYKIPLPTIAEQKLLLEKYNEAIEKADENEKYASRLNDEIDSYIFNALDCKKINITENNSLLHKKKYSKIINWSVRTNLNSISPKELFFSDKYTNTPLSLLAEINPETKYPDYLSDEKITFLPMECISDVYGDISEKKSETQTHLKDIPDLKTMTYYGQKSPLVCRTESVQLLMI